MEPESKFVEANGLNFHYLAWGDPQKPPLVMAHAIGLCAQIWNHAARDLAKDYYVISVDLRAHGDSEDPGNGYTFQQLGADMASVIQALELERPYAVGHSAGGMALLIADSLASGTVGKAVLVDTRVGESPMMLLTPEERVQRMERTAQKRSIWESREAMYQAYRERKAFKTWTEQIFGDYILGGTRLLEDGRAELKCTTEAEGAFYRDRETLETSQILLGLSGEYLLLVGNYEGAQIEQDAAVQHLMRESGGFQLKALERGTHFVPMEYPDLVLSEIRAFLDAK